MKASQIDDFQISSALRSNVFIVFLFFVLSSSCFSIQFNLTHKHQIKFNSDLCYLLINEMSEIAFTTSDLESLIQNGGNDEDERITDDTDEIDNSSDRRTHVTPSQYIIDCLNCQKEFDSTQFNANVELRLCSLCHEVLTTPTMMMLMIF
jgi:hypothetical protein